MPPTGPCRCGADHEHSDFEPFGCTEPGCPCITHRAPATCDIEPVLGATPSDAAGSRRGESARPHVTIPADALDFTRQRAADAEEWLDQIIDSLRGAVGHAADPLAVSTLADLIEQSQPDDVDVYAALAIAARRAAVDKPTMRQIAAGIARKVTR